MCLWEHAGCVKHYLYVTGSPVFCIWLFYSGTKPTGTEINQRPTDWQLLVRPCVIPLKVTTTAEKTISPRSTEILMTLLNPRFELLHLVYNKGEWGVGTERRKRREERGERNSSAKMESSKSTKRERSGGEEGGRLKPYQENRNTLVGNVQDYWTIINNLVSVGFIFLQISVPEELNGTLRYRIAAVLLRFWTSEQGDLRTSPSFSFHLPLIK